MTIFSPTNAEKLSPARAPSGGPFEAMLLSCIDPRFQEPVRTYLRDLTGQYSQFTIAGASVGVVAPRFKDWHETFWDNLEITVDLHQIKKVIVVNHRDCGAAAEANGSMEPGSQAETEYHRKVLTEFRKQLAERQPELDVETYLMDTAGNAVPLP